ncbi:MAG: hypothetical protein Q9182_005729 [Xanthomendoza sp. 2 TL-2023]
MDSTDYFCRDPPPLPPPSNLGDVNIIIRHPAYADGALPLLILKGLETEGDETGTHHGTVLTACTIISGRNDGHLSTVKEPEDASLGLQNDGLLPGGTYYFIVPGDWKYAIYPTFQHWTFPHGKLPPGWDSLPIPVPSRTQAPTQSSIDVHVSIRDGAKCIVSGYECAVEKAHLIPEAEMNWFHRNTMARYDVNNDLLHASPTNVMANLISLRADIHCVFDHKQQMLVFAPKGGKYHVHFFTKVYPFNQLYHNTRPNISSDIPREYLLARFAWKLFPLLRNFLLQGAPRAVRYAVEEEADNNEDRVEELSGAQITESFFDPPHPPSKKRGLMDATDESEANDGDDVQESKKRKVKNTQSNTSSDPPSLTYNQHSTKSTITISVARFKSQAKESAEECELVYDYADDGIDDPDPRVHDLYSNEHPLERLRRREVQRRRPYYNPELFCCDYDKDTRRVHAAIKEEGEWDSYQLCDECLGGEYQLRAQDIDDEEGLESGRVHED